MEVTPIRFDRDFLLTDENIFCEHLQHAVRNITSVCVAKFPTALSWPSSCFSCRLAAYGVASPSRAAGNDSISLGTRRTAQFSARSESDTARLTSVRDARRKRRNIMPSEASSVANSHNNRPTTSLSRRDGFSALDCSLPLASTVARGYRATFVEIRYMKFRTERPANDQRGRAAPACRTFG